MIEDTCARQIGSAETLGHWASSHGLLGRRHRASGILLHPTSLPGPHGIGDLGPAAYAFVDFLVAARQSLWQVLPLNPTGIAGSPYAAPSTFAGNPLLISLDRLVMDGLLQGDEIDAAAQASALGVDYNRTRALKIPLLRKAFQRFRDRRAAQLVPSFEEFGARHADWLDDYALFMALKARYRGAPWTKWQSDVASRLGEAIVCCRVELAEEIEHQRLLQFLFYRQWSELREYAHAHHVHIIGDLPIFVAHDSVDVWANRELFQLDEHGQPLVVAGVPPDYFSATGQRWGNPLYRWDRLAENGYAWWVARFRATMNTVDAVRIDHFRGFQAYWEVPTTQRTARYGRWVPGPGAALFRALETALGPLPIIVEDLGTITPEVEHLRDQLGYPGMKVLQFAFGGDATNPYLPHNYHHHCVVYTATHDNDTAVGWYVSSSAGDRAAIRRYLGTSGEQISWDLIRQAMASVADTAIVPLQDVLSLGSEGRMNFPGRSKGNWAWRYTSEQLAPQFAGRLAELTATYGREPDRGQFEGRSQPAHQTAQIVNGL